MFRAICLVGMAGTFLAVSGDLRNTVLDVAAQAVNGMEAHQPYSYVGLGFAFVAGLMIFVSRGSAPR
jgi:hypothetical protein